MIDKDDPSIVRIELPGGHETIIDAEDLPLAAGFQWYVQSKGYAGAMTVIDDRRTMILLHRLVMHAPADVWIDHKHGNKLDNRKAELRGTTPHLNQQNRRHLNRNNRSGARGVTWNSQRRAWIAQIMVMGKTKYIGQFKDRSDAIAARKQAELIYYGEHCP